MDPTTAEEAVGEMATTMTETKGRRVVVGARADPTRRIEVEAVAVATTTFA